jgi:hypothetical protein
MFRAHPWAAMSIIRNYVRVTRVLGRGGSPEGATAAYKLVPSGSEYRVARARPMLWTLPTRRIHDR